MLLLPLCCSISQSVFRFFRITIIRVFFSCSYCWTIKIWLIIFLSTGKSGELFRSTARISLKRKVYLFSANVACFWSILLLSITNALSCHVFEFSIQVMLSIAVDIASIISTPIASTVKIKAEFIGGSVVERLERSVCDPEAPSSSPALTTSWICSWWSRVKILSHACK